MVTRARACWQSGLEMSHRYARFPDEVPGATYMVCPRAHSGSMVGQVRQRLTCLTMV